MPRYQLRLALSAIQSLSQLHQVQIDPRATRGYLLAIYFRLLRTRSTYILLSLDGHAQLSLKSTASLQMHYTTMNIPSASIRASLISLLALVSTPSEDASSSALFGALGNAKPVSVTSSPDGSRKTLVSILLRISAMSRLQDHRNVTAMVMNASSSSLRRDLNFLTHT